MFLLYAVAIGLVLGLVVGGRPSALAALRLRWAGLALGGLLFQLVLFTDAVAARVGDLGPVLYVGSTVMVLVSLVRNWRVPGMPLVVLGALSNLAAIVANGGYMPAGRAALAALGKAEPVVYSNSSVVARPALEPLTDIFALPAWLPGANIFSVGDVLIGVGIALVIVLAMRRPRTGGAPSGAIPQPDAGGGASAH
jgi:hypothetical protein